MLIIFANKIESLVSIQAVGAINGYQKYISPRKGFSCAHRILYGGDSCSEYIKSLIAQKGLISALPLARQRFNDCRAANLILKAQNYPSRKKKRKNSSLHGCQPDCSGLDCLYCIDWDCTPDCGDIDCTPDCGDIPCDCCG